MAPATVWSTDGSALPRLFTLVAAGDIEISTVPEFARPIVLRDGQQLEFASADVLYIKPASLAAAEQLRATYDELHRDGGASDGGRDG